MQPRPICELSPDVGAEILEFTGYASRPHRGWLGQPPLAYHAAQLRQTIGYRCPLGLSQRHRHELARRYRVDEADWRRTLIGLLGQQRVSGELDPMVGAHPARSVLEIHRE